MEVSFRNFFIEPGVKFNISYKVNVKLSHSLNQAFASYLDVPGLAGWTTGINLISSKQTPDFKSVGPDENKRTKYYNYTFLIPYVKIRIDNPIEEYLDFAFQAFYQVLIEFKIVVGKQFFEKAKSSILSDIINNRSEYEI